ncbi:MAG: RnfH family protein [Variovorax sp.]|nr:MAG: RnfH family protein [Variovorax sp.]
MMQVTVVYSPGPRETFEETVTVPAGCTARDALVASALTTRYPDLDWPSTAHGVWGRACEWDQVLKDDDRLELCRPLTVDPKVARRERFQRQGARGTGLFANRRKGGKAGY